LNEALCGAGEEVVTSKEPTNGPWGRKIRESAATGRLPLEEELEAFIQDRTEHVASTISPALKKGAIVILDRYFYSTIAYQGARGAQIEALDEHMRRIAPVPDVVYILDVDPELALSRIRVRDSTPNEFEKVESLREVRSVFKRLLDYDDRLWEIDGAAPIELVQRGLLQHLLDNSLRLKRCAKEYGCDDPYHCAPRMTGTCRWASIGSALHGRLSLPSSIRSRRIAAV
jgi:dTMP kinase